MTDKHPIGCHHLSSVKTAYTRLANYRIHCNPSATRNETIVFFSSNGLFNPNTNEAASAALIEKNRFEWAAVAEYLTDFQQIIFLRDPYKSWYVNGISLTHDSDIKIASLLRKSINSNTYHFVGSSAGGFFAMHMASLMSPSTVISFAGQFDLKISLANDLNSSDPEFVSIYKPLLMRSPGYLTNYQKIYDSYSANRTRFYHFYPSLSPTDILQVQSLPLDILSLVRLIPLPTSNHGFLPAVYLLPSLITYLLSHDNNSNADSYHCVLFRSISSNLSKPRILISPFLRWLTIKLFRLARKPYF